MKWSALTSLELTALKVSPIVLHHNNIWCIIMVCCYHDKYYNIIDVSMDYRLMDPKFGQNNVSLMLHIINEGGPESNSLVYYNVTSPSQVEIYHKERSRFQLVIPYNELINVSITASLCGYQFGNPIIIHLNYSKYY